VSWRVRVLTVLIRVAVWLAGLSALIMLAMLMMIYGSGA
jgi:hypothetical protein